MTVKIFRIEYEYQGRTWATVVEAYDRESAIEQFNRDNPQCELRACDEDEKAG